MCFPMTNTRDQFHNNNKKKDENFVFAVYMSSTECD